MSGLCRDCKHFEPHNRGHSGSTALYGPFGACSRWYVGYGDYDMQPNECQVEGDEGWGMIVGPEFGCVLFAAQPVEEK